MNLTISYPSNTTLSYSNRTKNTEDGTAVECSDFKFYIISNTIFGIICILLSIIGTVSNILICIIYKEHITKTTSVSNQYFLVVCLAMADLLAATVTIPIEATLYLTIQREAFIFSQSLVVLFNAVWYCLTTLSLYMLLLMTLERFVSVKFPFYHLKKRHTAYAVITVIVYCLSVFSFYYFLQEISEDKDYFLIMPYWAEVFGLFVNTLIPSFANVAIYLYLFRIAKIQQRRIRQQTIEMVDQQQPSQQQNNNNKRKNRKNSSVQKTNKIYQNVMVLFCITWIPFLIFNIYTFIDISFYTTCAGSFMDSFTSLMVYMNNACNGLVYTVASKSFRHKLLHLTKRTKVS